MTSIFTFLDVSAAEYSAPPAPTLTQTDTRDSSVELLCQAPEGYGGLVFKLFKMRQLIDKVEHSNEQQGIRFILRGKDTEKENLYCCQYDSSVISFYMNPEPKGELFLLLYYVYTHTHTLVSMFLMGTFHKCNGFYTVQTVLSVPLP